jgi:hypothetical protein
LRARTLFGDPACELELFHPPGVLGVFEAEAPDPPVGRLYPEVLDRELSGGGLIILGAPVRCEVE